MIREATVEAIKRELAGHLRSRTEWDELPAVFTLHQGPGLGMHMMRIPVPNDVWTRIGHPPSVVAALVDIANQLPRHADGSHMLVMPGAGRLLGVAFRYEAYAVSADSDSPAAREAARRRTAGGSVPRFKDISGRTEQRCMAAVDIDGGRYNASSNRVDEAGSDATEPRVDYFAFTDPDRQLFTGRVVDATNRLLNAIKPVPAKGATR